MSFNNFKNCNHFTKTCLNLCLIFSFSFISPIVFGDNVPYLDLTEMKKQIEVKDKNFYQKPDFDNEGYTFGDVYNQGEMKDRNKVNFQKNKSLHRLERADGTYDAQRKQFLTEDSLNHSHLILSAKQGIGYVETPKFISIRKDKTLSQAKLEEEKNRKLYENRSQANDATYGQRLQKLSQKRVILLHQSQDRKNSLQDSTYVEIDCDMTLPSSPYSPYNIHSIDKNRIHTYK